MDRDWDDLIERIDLDVSDADLAAAEERLRQMPAEDVVPVREDLVAATMARVQGLQAEEDEPAIAPVHAGWFGGMKRWAAAVFAVFGIHTAATAAVTVTAVTVVAVVTVSVLWPEMRNSDETMSFAAAVEILQLSSEPIEAKQAAVNNLIQAVGQFAVCARELSADSSVSAPLQSAAVRHRRLLLSVAGGSHRVTTVPVADDYEARYAGVKASSLDDFDALGEMCAVALQAISDLEEPELRLARDRALRGIARLLED